MVKEKLRRSPFRHALIEGKIGRMIEHSLITSSRRLISLATLAWLLSAVCTARAEETPSQPSALFPELPKVGLARPKDVEGDQDRISHGGFLNKGGARKPSKSAIGQRYDGRQRGPLAVRSAVLIPVLPARCRQNAQ